MPEIEHNLQVAYKAVGEISQADKFIPAHLIDVEAEDEFMKEEVR